MTPAQLDALLAVTRKDHGALTCPKCSNGYMAYQRAGSSSFFACQECAWIEHTNPPWTPRP
jgi:transposase-like protein